MYQVTVTVVEFGDRPHYQMQWRDPITGRKKTRSTKVERTGRKRDRNDAERVAAKLEAEIREGRYAAPSKTTWDEFRQKYELEVITGRAESTAKKVSGVLNAVERILRPRLVRDITAERLLESVPPPDRHGFVFGPLPLRHRHVRLSGQQVMRIIARVGEAAGVKVREEGRTVKYASAHDLRRSFGATWAPKVMPQVLKELMRHESIETTLKFYVGRNAEATADALWSALNQTGDPVIK